MSMLAGLPATVGSIMNPTVVKASSRAVGELLCCCALGVVAARKGILSPVNVAALSKVRVSVSPPYAWNGCERSFKYYLGDFALVRLECACKVTPAAAHVTRTIDPPSPSVDMVL